MSLKCPKFDYKTSQKIDLVKHIKDHYDCDHCDKGFYGGSGKRQLKYGFHEKYFRKSETLTS